MIEIANLSGMPDCENTLLMSDSTAGCFKTTTKCHPGGFTLCRENVTKCHIFERWRRVKESEPSPGSEQIEHTKTESLYAKLCEREVNPRQLVSGSYQPGDSTHDRSDSEHTCLVNDSTAGRFRMTV